MPKVSVIIRIYNAKKYLIECLNSITTQTLKDIEIIYVNDGSSDDSQLIIEAFCEIDHRVYLFNQKNKSTRATRNQGIDFATGDYVYFMDADDYLEKNTINIIYNLAIEKDVDFLMFKISNFYDDTKEHFNEDYYTMPYLKRKIDKRVFNYDNVSDIALDLCVCPLENLFRRYFIENIRFPEGLNIEDNVFFTHTLFKANRIYFHDEFLYNHKKHYDSVSSTPLIKILNTIEITKRLLNLANEFNPPHKAELYYRIFPNIYNIFKQTEKSKKQKYYDKIKKEYEENKTKWESDEYLQKNLNSMYRHMVKCVLEPERRWCFQSCMDKYFVQKNPEEYTRFTQLIGAFS